MNRQLRCLVRHAEHNGLRIHTRVIVGSSRPQGNGKFVERPKALVWWRRAARAVVQMFSDLPRQGERPRSPGIVVRAGRAAARRAEATCGTARRSVAYPSLRPLALLSFAGSRT
jgi:hypothetical protein